MHSHARQGLTPETVGRTLRCSGHADAAPRITMGVGTILECRRCVLLATGREKADVIAKAVEGPVTAMISATALQLHPNCTVIVDQEAGSLLQNTDYYRWIFENEPDWQQYH